MKKNIPFVTLLCGFAIMVAGAMTMSSCSNNDDVDATESCTLCHNDEVVLFAKQQQTESSHHLKGGNYDRSHADCAICHTHQGFIETLESGALEASADIMDPAAINCRTCHMIHTDFEASDWDLVSETPVVLDFGEGTIDIGKGNLCVNCHQFRTVSPMPVMGGGDVTITSSRWGPHYGAQGNMIWGVGGYQIAGSKSYPAAGSAGHVEAGCNTCHMAAQPYSATASGGHTFNMTDGPDGSENIGACTGCHSTLEEFDYNGIQTKVDELLAELETIFIEKGYISEPGGLWKASSSSPIVVSSDEAGAMLNFKIVTYDHSKGIHNPAYMIALLTNSLESLQ